MSRDADDLVGALRVCREAERFDQALPRRLGKCTREGAPEKTRILRVSRVHSGLRRRFTVVGFAGFWQEDRQGVPRVKRRTARKTLQRACQRIKEWMQAHRHVPGKAFFSGLNARLRGHDNY